MLSHGVQVPRMIFPPIKPCAKLLVLGDIPITANAAVVLQQLPISLLQLNKIFKGSLPFNRTGMICSVPCLLWASLSRLYFLTNVFKCYCNANRETVQILK